jgi:hypothetical protein
MDACEAALTGLDCGGPVAGMSFPLYEGPLTLDGIARHCCFCGGPAVEAVTSQKQPTRFVGLCRKHLPAIERLVVVSELTRRPKEAAHG